mmetsp:Transcript_28068/g.74176  ORF Transcript_28068/g.74176 Transcript_28068/m.74176 type:complete len:83 (-) Transcript_28068:1251-1499(-)
MKAESVIGLWHTRDMIIGATDPVRQSTKHRDHATLDTCYKWCHSSIIRSRLKNAVAHGSLVATLTMCKSQHPKIKRFVVSDA